MIRSALLAAAVLSICSLAARAETTLAQIDLSRDKPGEAPATAPLKPGETSTHFTTLNTKGGNTLAVADKVGTLKGPTLKFDKKDDVNGAPAAMLALEPVSAGKVRISWQAVVEQYQKGSRSQALEPLLTLNLLGKDGLSMFSLEYLVTEGSGGGQFSVPGLKARFDRWDFKEHNNLTLDIDLDDQSCALTIDGKSAGEKIKFANAGPLRFVQFRDGTGLGGVDGKFTGAIADLKVVRDPAAKPDGKKDKK